MGEGTEPLSTIMEIISVDFHKIHVSLFCEAMLPKNTASPPPPPSTMLVKTLIIELQVNIVSASLANFSIVHELISTDTGLLNNKNIYSPHLLFGRDHQVRRYQDHLRPIYTNMTLKQTKWKI
jgi:hypothetical protein